MSLHVFGTARHVFSEMMASCTCTAVVPGTLEFTDNGDKHCFHELACMQAALSKLINRFPVLCIRAVYMVHSPADEADEEENWSWGKRKWHSWNDDQDLC